MTSEIARELNQETSSGGLKMDVLAVNLIATLAHDHCETSHSRPPVALAKGLLDRRRLNRVLEFIETNLESDISVSDLADAALLQPFPLRQGFSFGNGPRA